MSDDSDRTRLTAESVSAYVEKNAIAPTEIAGLIQSVHRALAMVGAPAVEVPPATQTLSPAQIRKSITPDALISFEDGKPYKQLKRHLSTRGMTVAEYRAKWSLPSDYPTVAATYSALRSEHAKRIGLGSKGALRKGTPAKRGKSR